ncbi:sporulation-specific protein 15 [Musa acuminata AAA Group]|uniref:sporulation-specific protein 15 n=1 Tax=Musa acuminata AAA Group TaxID=214697 RepID=UPI0031DB7CA6
MSRIPKWKIEKTKVKVVFRLQFHATHIPQGWDKLFVSFIPIDTGKATAKTNKANVRNGICKWPDPVYETARLLQDTRTKNYDEKHYKLVVAMGSPRTSFLGEVNINLADFADALKPSSVSLPLNNCDFGTILHVTVQLLTSKTGFREFEQQHKLSIKGAQMISSHRNNPAEAETTSSVIANELTEKVDARVRYEDHMGLLSLEPVGESNEDYDDSSVGVDGSSYTSENLYTEKKDLQSMICHDVPLSESPMPGTGDPNGSQLSNQGRNGWTHGWSSNYSVANLTTASEENTRLRVRLEVAESAFLQLKLEAKSLQRVTDELGAETQSLSKQFSFELTSGEQLTREVSVLKVECSKFRDDLEALKSAKFMQQNADQRTCCPLILNHNLGDDSNAGKLQNDTAAAETHYMYHDMRVKWLESLLLVESKVLEIQNKACLDFDYLGPDFDLLGCVIGDLKEDIIQVKGLDRSYRDNDHLEHTVHLLTDSHTVYNEHGTLQNNLEHLSLREDKMFDLLPKLEELTTEKESLTKKMDQMHCYYESLILELEQSQKQTVEELENLRNEHSSCLYSISVLKNQIEKMHQEMNEQYITFAEDRTSLESQNKELERRAIASENALKRVRWNYSIAFDRLQKDLELLSFQVLSMYETNENLAKQALADAYQHYHEESPEEARSCTDKDGMPTSFDQEHYQSGLPRIQAENGPYGTTHKWYSLDNGGSISVCCKASSITSQEGVPTHVELRTRDETHMDGFNSHKIGQHVLHHTQNTSKLTAGLSPGTYRDEEFPKRSAILMSKLDSQWLDDAKATQSRSLYPESDKQQMVDANGIEEMRISFHMLKLLHSNMEAELSEMHMLNMNLKVFSEVLQCILYDANDEVRHMKGIMLELAQQLQRETEIKDSLMLQLHKALDEARVFRDDKAECISRCEGLTLKNQVLEAKLQDVSDESAILSEKVAEYERLFVESKVYEKEYKACIEERDKLKILLKEENLQKDCLKAELSSIIEDFKTLKEESEMKSSENDKMRTCVDHLQENLGYLYTCMSSCYEQINYSAPGGISVIQEFEAGNYMPVIMNLEQFQKDTTKKILQLHQENRDIKEQRYIAQCSQKKSESEFLSMKQKFESELHEVTEKLEMSNVLVEKLQVELQNVLEKLKISSEAEEKNESRNRELSSKLTNFEIELQRATDENKDLINQLLVLASVKEELEKTRFSLMNCMQERRTLSMSIQSGNEASTQMENELHSLKESLQCTHRDMQIEKKLREELEAAVTSLSAQLKEKDQELLSFCEQKTEVAYLQKMIVDLEKTNTGFQHLLLKNEENQRRLDVENLSLHVQIMDMENQLATILENSLAAEMKVTFMRSQLCENAQKLFAQLKTLERELEEMNLKHENVVTLLNTCSANEAQLTEENARLSVALQSLQSDYDSVFQEKENLIDYVNKRNASWTEFEDIKVRASTLEADSNHQKQKYEDEISQLKNMLISFEEEVCNLRSYKVALEVTDIVLRSKLNEQQTKGLLLEECDHELRTLQEHHNELSCKLSEQILKAEEYKNLSIHLRELKDKAEAECLQAREKKENERSSQESLRIAFIKEQHESKIQELKNQLFVSKKYAEEMLLKLQNALDEVECTKKNEVSLLKMIEELSGKISNLESELERVLTDRRELAKTYDRIKNELECTIFNFDCCKEEKLMLEGSLKECNEERTKAKVELDLVKRLFSNMASNETINLESSNNSGFPTTTSIEQILQDSSVGFPSVFQEMPNDRGTCFGIDASAGIVSNPLNNIDVNLWKTGGELNSNGDVEVMMSTCANESSLSCPVLSSQAFKDTGGTLERHTLFADNTTYITATEEHFKELQRLMSGMNMLQKELEKLKNENLSSLIPLDDHQSLPSLPGLERDLSQLDMANEQLRSIFPLFKELPGNGNALERVLSLELELAETLQTKKKADFCFQSSFLKQHTDEEVGFQSFKDINELIKEMLELKSRNAAVETELNEMQGRYSQLSLQFAEVEGERQKLQMILKSRVPKRP